MFSYNTSVHEGTKCTSYELVFGKLTREPSSKPLSQQEKFKTYDDYLINFVTQLHEMRTQARENLISAKEKSKIYYDEKINPWEVKIGDNVFLLKGGKIKKLDSHYTGPYEILEVYVYIHIQFYHSSQTHRWSHWNSSLFYRHGSSLAIFNSNWNF